MIAGCGHFLLKISLEKSTFLRHFNQSASKFCVSQCMLFWFDITIIFTLFTPKIDDDFFGYLINVPCILQLHFVLCTLPRWKNVIFFESFGDPFLQISIKTNANEMIIYCKNITFFMVKMAFCIIFLIFSKFCSSTFMPMCYVIVFYAVKNEFSIVIIENCKEILHLLLAPFLIF